MTTFLASDVHPKDPDASKVYTMNWSAELNAGATISTSTWAVQPGIIKDSDGIAVSGLTTSIQLSGGVAGGDYVVTNRVTTSDGEVDERSAVVPVRER